MPIDQTNAAAVKALMDIRMANVLPEARLGSARIEHIEVTPEEAHHRSEMARIRRRPHEWVTAGRFAILMVDGELWMSDQGMERDSNREVVERATGDVLIAGLGIGMIVLPIMFKPTVRSVTVIERSADVIGLVEQPLRDVSGEFGRKLIVVEADIHDYKPEKGRVWDVVYFDIWKSISTSNLEAMTHLHRRFGRRKRVWMGSWMHEALLDARRYR